MNEFDFIAALRKLAHHPAARGLADDCAVLEVGNETLVLTHDALVEGVHYLPSQDLADVAWKLVAANLSDLAAKGAEPVGVLLGAMLGDGDARFLAGLEEVLAEYDVPLLGGDTVAAPKGAARSFGLTAIGRASVTPVPSRGGALPGDGVYLCGSVGAAMIGLEDIRGGAWDTSAAFAYRRPRPLLAEGRALAPLVSAMMDVSDGLLLDARRMAEASGVTFRIDGDAVPLSAPEGRRDEALRWGDDYALLFTAEPRSEWPVAIAQIGMVGEANSAPLLVDGKAPLPDDALGYRHEG